MAKRAFAIPLITKEQLETLASGVPVNITWTAGATMVTEGHSEGFVGKGGNSAKSIVQHAEIQT